MPYIAPQKPQLTVALPSFSAEDPGDWSHMFARARAADAAGVDRLMCSDHIVFGERLEEYGKAETGGAAGGKQPTGPDGHWLEPLTTLSVIAGMTSRIRLRTQILLAALRRPAVLAKTTSTLDVLSGGRLDLGVGVGWQSEEYEAAGLPFAGRGRLLDHALEVCQVLWRDQRAAYDSPELKFDAIHQMPKPIQPGGVPLWIAGTLRGTTVGRLARFGARWIPWGPDAADLKASIPRLKALLAEAGAKLDGLEVVGRMRVSAKDGAAGLAAALDRVAEDHAAGVTDFVLEAQIPEEETAARAMLEDVVSAFRKAVGRPAN
jgi:probable F420-dependent oxidoreductase